MSDPLWQAGKVRLLQRHGDKETYRQYADQLRSYQVVLDELIGVKEAREREGLDPSLFVGVKLNEGEDLVSYAVRTADGTIEVRRFEG